MYKIGLFGSAITSLCIFTPILAQLLIAVGAESIIPTLDKVLLPVLAVFVIMMLVGRSRRGSE